MFTETAFATQLALRSAIFPETGAEIRFPPQERMDPFGFSHCGSSNTEPGALATGFNFG